MRGLSRLEPTRPLASDKAARPQALCPGASRTKGTNAGLGDGDGAETVWARGTRMTGASVRSRKLTPRSPERPRSSFSSPPSANRVVGGECLRKERDVNVRCRRTD